MSRSSHRRRGRAYQPLPRRRTNAWIVRLVVISIGMAVVLGSLALLAGT